MSSPNAGEDSPEQRRRRCCCLSHEFYTAVASADPDAIAVIHASLAADFTIIPSSSSFPPVYGGDEVFTYGDLLAAVESLSRKIRGILDGAAAADEPGLFHLQKGNGDRSSSYVMNSEGTSLSRCPKIVGVYIKPSVEYIVAVLSILRCDEAFLPLDPLWPEERISYAVSSSNAALIITKQPKLNEDHLFVGSRNCPVLFISMKLGITEKCELLDLAWPCEAQRKRRFCYLMYTSGSTGRPKGVCGTEEGLLNRFCWMKEKFPFCEEEILLFKTSISFVDHLQEFLCAILSCKPLVVPPHEELKAFPARVVNFLKAYNISRLISVPSVMKAILPPLEALHQSPVQNTLKVLVLSGENFPISLWAALQKILPGTTILNLYGSTEVSGDCTYFDCKSLPNLLSSQPLSSVPIGEPIWNCEIVLIGQSNKADEGEICVSGACVFAGYFRENEGTVNPVDAPLYFKTSDVARRVHGGNLLFLGRKDRTIKIRGQRVALEEIENSLRSHPAVNDAAVIVHKTDEEVTSVGAFFVPKDPYLFKNGQALESGEHDSLENLILSIKSWLVKKLPLVMIPSSYTCLENLPVNASGKVDYASLERSVYTRKRQRSLHQRIISDNYLLKVKKVFSEALLIDEVTDDDDFFMMGGNSISAAHVAYKLGIDMRLLYVSSTPRKLLIAMLKGNNSLEKDLSQSITLGKRLKVQKSNLISYYTNEYDDNSQCFEGLLELPAATLVNHLPKQVDEDQLIATQVDSDATFSASFDLDEAPMSSTGGANLVDNHQWLSKFSSTITCSFSRCNKVMCEGSPDFYCGHKSHTLFDVPYHGKSRLQELWKVPLDSCVDASPLIVLTNGNISIYIGSHSHIFLCVDGLSGYVRWKVTLEGRVECSAAITDDFVQVVVGCFKGKIYFLNHMSGNICWVFQTAGEVKMQPLMDKQRHLVWCGSHDHFLYALDYRGYSCTYKVSCSGSVYGTPSIDKVHDMLYVASTSGRITAISLQVLPFKVLWRYESGAPIFGSLSLDSTTGHVICCLVNGHVIALDSTGSTIWKAITGGPLFAGACLSMSLPSQVLICSRDGNVYSYHVENGTLLWQYQLGDPISASACIDECTKLVSESSLSCYRMACITSSSGCIHVLKINSIIKQARSRQIGYLENDLVQEFAVMDLPGDVFSSPVMIGGRIYVGCRDDFLHCISIAS